MSTRIAFEAIFQTRIARRVKVARTIFAPDNFEFTAALFGAIITLFILAVLN